jgi:alternate signal-mediated exported protein
MNNLKKTVAAGVVGIALLAGTAGTFATWQNSDSAAVGTLATGDLSISANVGDWFLINANGGNISQATAGTGIVVRSSNLSDLLLVPGRGARAELFGIVETRGLTINDVVVTSQGIDLDLVDGFLPGTNLRFTIENEEIPTGISGINGTNGADRNGFRTFLRVDFVRDSAEHMYDNDFSQNLGDLKVTVTMR